MSGGMYEARKASLHANVVQADRQSPRLGDGQDGRLVERPAHVGSGLQLRQGEGLVSQGPEDGVARELLSVHGDIGALDQRCPDATVVGDADPDLEAGDLASRRSRS